MSIVVFSSILCFILYLFHTLIFFPSVFVGMSVCLFLCLFRTQVIQAVADHFSYLPSFNVLNLCETSLQHALVMQ
jgi:hypothetical protein